MSSMAGCNERLTAASMEEASWGFPIHGIGREGKAGGDGIFGDFVWRDRLALTQSYGY
jgi:hypothetical protein